MIGFVDIRFNVFTTAISSSLKCSFTSINEQSWSNSSSFVNTLFSSTAALSPPFAAFEILACLRSTDAISASASSVLIVSISLIGSTFPSTWIVFGSSKHLTTSIIASTSLIFCKN